MFKQVHKKGGKSTFTCYYTYASDDTLQLSKVFISEDKYREVAEFTGILNKPCYLQRLYDPFQV